MHLHIVILNILMYNIHSNIIYIVLRRNRHLKEETNEFRQ